MTADRIRVEERAREVVIEIAKVKARWLTSAETIDRKKEVL